LARTGIDTGGTFTDLVRIGPEGTTVAKVASTPDDPARAVLDGLDQLEAADGADRLIHGTTVATNALLTRTGGPIAFITTKGFRDVLEIGRQDRPDLYALVPEPVPVLVPRRLRLEVPERTRASGEVALPLDEAALARLVPRLRRAGVRAVAGGVLHSYANPRNERRAAAILRRAGLLVSASHEVLREHREHERFSTTAVNAYVAPVVSAYLTRLARRVGPERLAVMQSNGGIVSWRASVKSPVRTVLSGPAGGVVAALEAGRRAGLEDVVSFDMGGTSTDVSLATGELRRTTEFRISGVPIGIPVLDILTVGAGGGSIARVDAGGALAVGPRSAGAVPGPISYGRGGREITVTDAHVVLGRLPPERFLGGRMTLHPELLDAPMRRLARDAGLSPVEAALGVLRVAEATMARAIRVISLERGHDTAGLTLVSFGGAGGLHAARLAASLGMPRVLVPPDPGAFSAHGMAAADVVQDASVAFLRQLGPRSERALAREMSRLTSRLSRSMAAEGVEAPAFHAGLDLRYRGQSFEIPVTVGDDLDLEAVRGEFHRAHERLYSARHEDREVEAVALRVRAVGEVEVPAPRAMRSGKPDASQALDETREVVFREGVRRTRFFSRDRLRAGNRIDGPAVITETTSTTVVPPGFGVEADRLGNLLLS
jgi:N-methylhydantoinase A